MKSATVGNRRGAPTIGRKVAGRSSHPAEPWTEARVREELERFLVGRSEWPSYRAFQRAGRKGLRDAVTRLGGARHWAGKLGVAFFERPPGYAPTWTEERIRDDLTHFLEGERVWPPRTAFEEAGLKPLRDAVARTGGPPRWAPEFGLPRRDERQGSRRVWTEERIERELRELLGGGEEWPSVPAFREAGKTSLLAAVYAHGGPTRWSRRLGVHRQAGGGTRRERAWTEERIRVELEEFCAGCSEWPRWSEFEAAGRGALYRAASRYGGIRRWKRRLGLR